MNKCSVCENEFEDKYFDTEQQKCIFHCEKNENNGWINDTQWSIEKVHKFWNYYVDYKCFPIKSKIPPLLSYPLNTISDISIYDCELLDIFEIDAYNKINITISETILQSDIKINIWHTEENVEISFDRNTHNGNINIKGNANFEIWIANNIRLLNIDMSPIKFGENNKFTKITIVKNCPINKINLNNVNISKKFIMNNQKVNYFNCSNSIFEEKVEMKENIFYKTSFFKNTKFKSLCDFYKTEFNCNSFYKSTFDDISVFTEAVFHKKVEFKYTTFSKLALFRKTNFEKTVDFEDSIFKEEANFLNMNANVANRETARIIKNSFEQQNNIIEANRFYALEMKEREKELYEDILKCDNVLEWLIFKIHSISSDHSQSWFLALLWVLIVTIVYSIGSTESISINKNIFTGTAVIGVLTICVIACIKEKKYKKHIVSFLLFILLLINYIVITQTPFDALAKIINPFGKVGKDITIGLLIVKIIIAYLIYQFIVSVRQNTRRK